MSITARAATAGEIIKFRSPQAARVYAIFDVPATVFACQINQAFTTHDMIAQVTYNNVTAGAYTDVAYGMTAYVGSTPGDWDIGITYIRKAATSDVLYIGENSEIAWADDLFVTVVDDFGIWADHLRIQYDGTALMRYDVTYSDQHTDKDPVPVIGSDQAKRLTGADVTFSFDSSDSYVYGSSIASHAWSFPGAASTTGTTTATPTATYDTTGRYRVIYTVTAANGKSRTAYRNIYVFDNATLIKDVIINSCSYDWESGGGNFEMTLYTDEDIAAIHDRTKVLLIEEAWYCDSSDFPAGSPESIGPLEGSENIIATGWLDNETFSIDYIKGEMTMMAYAANFWLAKIPGFIIGLENTGSAPAAWTEMQNLTVDLALWHFLAWRSTIMNCCDVILTGDSRIATALEAPQGNLWQQITTMAEETIFAHPCVDPYGRLFVQVDLALLPSADRSGIPVVMTLSKDDYENIDVMRMTVPKVARLEMSGVAIVNSQAVALFSLAPGHVFRHYGEISQKEQLLLTDQSQANQLAADWEARENRPYQFEISGAANNRLVGICPQQFLALDIAADDNLRGIVYDGNVIVRRVEWMHNAEAGSLVSSWYADAETSGDLMVNGDIPANDDAGEIPAWNPPPVPSFPPLPPLPPTPTPVNGQPRNLVMLTTSGIWYTSEFDQAEPRWYSMNANFSATHISEMRYLVANKAGRLYCASLHQTWTAMLGEQFQLLTYSNYWDLHYPPGWFLKGLGCNPNLSDNVIILAGTQYPGGFTDVHYGSFAAGIDDVLRLSIYAEDGGCITYGNGSFLATYPTGIFFDNVILRLSGDGTTEEYVENTGTDIGAQPSYSNRSNQADFLWWPTEDELRTDSGETGTALTSIDISNRPQAVASDPSGLFVMAEESSAPKYSSDGGTIWGTISAFPKATAPFSAIYSLDADRFIWASGTVGFTGDAGIWYTPDFGATWYDKTGNLADFLGPDFHPLMIQVLP